MLKSRPKYNKLETEMSEIPSLDKFSKNKFNPTYLSKLTREQKYELCKEFKNLETPSIWIRDVYGISTTRNNDELLHDFVEFLDDWEGMTDEDLVQNCYVEDIIGACDDNMLTTHHSGLLIKMSIINIAVIAHVLKIKLDNNESRLTISTKIINYKSENLNENHFA